MKNFKFIMITTVIVLLLSGCSLLDGFTVSSEEKYAALSALMENPANASDEDINTLSKDFTFSVYTITEAEEWDLDGSAYQIVVGMISRNVDDYVLLSVDGLDDYNYPEGTYLSVTAKLEGTIYWDFEGEQVEVLHVSAKKAAPLEHENREPSESSMFQIDTPSMKGTFDFSEAQRTSVLVDESAVNVYYNFVNEMDSDQLPKLDGLMFYQNDIMLKPLVFSGSSVIREGAREANFQNTTAPQEEGYYFVSMSAKYSDETLNDTDPIDIVMYDDDFNIIQYYVLELTD